MQLMDIKREGESIFLFAPSCVNVTSSSPEEASPSNVPAENTPQYSLGKILLLNQHGVILI